MNEKIKCIRCGYSWLPRKEVSEIISCPDCKSRLWNVKKVMIEVDPYESNSNTKN